MKYEIDDYETQHGKPAKVLFIDDSGNLFGVAKPRNMWRPREWNPDGICFDFSDDTLAPIRREWWLVKTTDIGTHAFTYHDVAKRFAADQDVNHEIIHVREELEDD